MPTPITSRTPTGRDLLRDGTYLLVLLGISAAAMAGSWPGKALGLVGLLVCGSDGLRWLLETARWRRVGSLTWAYDWDDAVPGGTVGGSLESDRTSLVAPDWSVRLVAVAVQRRQGLTEETTVWEGSGQVMGPQRTPTGCRFGFRVAIPAGAAAPGAGARVDWHLHLTGTGGRRPIVLTVDLGVHPRLDAGDQTPARSEG